MGLGWSVQCVAGRHRFLLSEPICHGAVSDHDHAHQCPPHPHPSLPDSAHRRGDVCPREGRGGPQACRAPSALPGQRRRPLPHGHQADAVRGQWGAVGQVVVAGRAMQGGALWCSTASSVCMVTCRTPHLLLPPPPPPPMLPCSLHCPPALQGRGQAVCRLLRRRHHRGVPAGAGHQARR